MLIVFNAQHHLHHGSELKDGAIAPSFEKPERADLILNELKKRQCGEIIAQQRFDRHFYVAAHSERYVSFLENAWQEWELAGNQCDALPLVWPVRDLAINHEPEYIDGKLGFYSMDAGAPITAGTCQAVKASADCALTALHHLISSHQSSAFALCRPPGHHAAKEYMGGYCYLNNVAIAAQAAIEQGKKRVAILDVDFHHGNGTQNIFYDRNDVYFVSIHGNPKQCYPYFSGFEHEKGVGQGIGYNRNYPLVEGTKWEGYKTALLSALDQIDQFQPELLLISLGVDTFKSDPISHFKLESDDYFTMGEMIANLNIPTLFVMEGGYMVEEIGINVANVLQGFEGV
ncbi:histone deacetylase family protein [Acinetobacter soli]|uniref:histone deacetylase family protein n=1 Tax=Acinetobacter soli TaxID=487316 RepID=UPI0032B3A0FA